MKLSSSGSTLNVTVKTKSDGKSGAVDLKKVWLEHMVGVRASGGGDGGGGESEDVEVKASGGRCCMVQ